MPAWATREKVGENAPLGNLILPVPDTDFREFLDEVEPLAGFAPEIITGQLWRETATCTRFRRQHRRGLSARRWDRPFSA